MIRLIAAAALTAAVFAMPTVPVQAAMLDDAMDTCWILPMLKDECAPTPPEATAAPAVVAASAEEAASTFAWPFPSPWSCERAAAGSKHLFECY